MYRVVVIRKGMRARIGFKKPNNALACFKQAAAKFGEKRVFFVFNAPKGNVKHLPLNYKEYWCPYCRAPRKFPLDKKLEVRRCYVCGISERDWYVLGYNPDLMPPLVSKTRRRSKKHVQTDPAIEAKREARRARRRARQQRKNNAS